MANTTSQSTETYDKDLVIQRLSDEITTLSKALDRKQTSHETTKNELADCRARNKDLQSKFDGLQTSYEATTNALAAFRTQNEDLQYKLNESVTLHEATKTRLSHVEALASDCQIRLEMREEDEEGYRDRFRKEVRDEYEDRYREAVQKGYIPGEVDDGEKRGDDEFGTKRFMEWMAAGCIQ